MKHPIAVAAVMAAAVIVFGTREAEACACAGPSEPAPVEEIKKKRDKAIAVFAGQVVVLDATTVTFRVQKVWKGAVPTKLTMATGAVDNGDGTTTMSTCDVSFEAGQRYLVFAYGRSLSDMRAHHCDFTYVLAHAGDTVRKLDTLRVRR